MRPYYGRHVFTGTIIMTKHQLGTLLKTPSRFKDHNLLFASECPQQFCFCYSCENRITLSYRISFSCLFFEKTLQLPVLLELFHPYYRFYFLKRNFQITKTETCTVVTPKNYFFIRKTVAYRCRQMNVCKRFFLVNAFFLEINLK